MADYSDNPGKADASGIWKKRHTAAHVMAQAVTEMFPDAGLAIGPPIEDGFYYDFDLPRTLPPDGLVEIKSRIGIVAVLGSGKYGSARMAPEAGGLVPPKT